MRDARLRDYYERELTFLRHMGVEFAESYKDVAARLRIETTRAEDPHVERLLQGFAFLAARVHLKVDDDFPEISQAFLNTLYPHYLRPVPSMSLVEFRLDPDQGAPASGWKIPRGARLVTPPTSTGVRCRFRTCYETRVWPLEVTRAGWHTPHEIEIPYPTNAMAILRVDLRTVGQLTFDELDLGSVRFFLDGEAGLVGSLYELLLNNCVQVVAWDPALGRSGKKIQLPPGAIRAVGFERHESMLPNPRQAFAAYQLIQEYFAFPRKYFFVDVNELERLRGAGLGTTVQLLFLITGFQRPERHARLQEGVSQRTLKLGCCPIVNLFPTEARPINLTQRKSEYSVSVSGETEVLSVEKVFAIEPGTTRQLPIPAFHGLKHKSAHSGENLFWYAKREPRTWGENSVSEVSIAFVDVDGSTVQPEYQSIGVSVLCSNADLPNELRFGTKQSDFFLEEESAKLKGIFTLMNPTRSIRPPLGGRELWRLISMLSLNHLSLVDEGIEPFREILRAHAFGDTELTERQVDGITRVRSEPLYAPVQGAHGLSFARGRSVEIEFDEELFTGGSVYLFASVIERFLAQYASLNSFSRVVAKTKQRPEILKSWPPRAGLKPLL